VDQASRPRGRNAPKRSARVAVPPRTTRGPAADPVGFRQSLLQLLEANPPEEEKLLAVFEGARHAGYPLYSAVLYILTHLNFSEPEARRHWRRIRRHRDSLQLELGRDVGLRVALLDYFVNFSRELKNPKVIEISIYERTARSAVTDGLTGLYNHTYFLNALRREVQRSKRHGLQLSLIMLDLDDFKRINDSRGHLEGDRVLVKASSLVAESLREIDLAARYGGEEFAVVLPDTPRMGAFVVADRIRRRVEDHFRRKRGAPTVTLSGGVATYPEDASDTDDLIRRADEGLYRSKADGKNRVTLMAGERRRHTRMSVRHAVTLGEGRRPRAGRALNLSDGGLGLSVRESVPVGTPITVTLRPEGLPPMAVRGEVVRCQRDPQARGRHELGVRLANDPLHREALVVLRRVGSAR
jgi:diguanylate cyclase (GGDEF)-like protein